MRRLQTLCACLLLALSVRGAVADRIVLAPEASTLAADGWKLDASVSPSRSFENVSWIQFSTPQSMEIEVQRWDLLGDRKLRHSLNFQYPLLSDLGTFPAVSVGIRDILGSGVEKPSFYLAIGKALPLSDSQVRLWREIRFSAGAGTGYINGVFLGVQARLRSGLQISAEFFRYRPNISLSVPLLPHLQAKATSLDGRLFYGLTFTFAR